MNIRKAMGGVMLLNLAAVPTVTHAQNQDAQSTVLADVVVTAQRREQKLQDVPIAVTVVSGSQLKASGVPDTAAIAIVTPSLVIQNTVGNIAPRIRGIGNAVAGAGSENSVATYIDGVYIASTAASLLSLSGVERVEVLKGPQGTLFGRNATGGLIQVVTRTPSIVPGGNIDVSYGNYNTFSVDGYVTGGLAENLAVDFAGHALFQGEGYGVNQATGKDTNRADHDLAFRSKLSYRPNDGLAVLLSGDYQNSKGSPAALRPSPYGSQIFGPSPAGNNPWDTNSNIPYLMRAESGGVSLNVKKDVGLATVTSVSAWRKSVFDGQFDIDLTPIEAIDLKQRIKDDQFSQELQLSSNGNSKISWVVGAFFFKSKASLDPTDIFLSPPVVNPPTDLHTADSQKTTSYAAFGQVTVPVTSAVNLTAGLRYTDEDKTFEGVETAILHGIPIPPITIGQSSPRSVKFDKLTWRLAVDAKLTPGVMAYASYNRGFKSGGFNLGGGMSDPPYAPETLDAYEVGIKASAFEHRLTFNPSVFYYDYKNIQVPYYVQGNQLISNGSSAKLYGLDVDFAAAVTRALTLRGGLTLIHDRFGDFPGAILATPLPIGGNSLTSFNARGNRIPYTADWSASLAADYTVPVSFGETIFNVTYNHNDGYYTEPDNLRRQKAFDLLNASVKLTNQSGSMYVSLWGKNLADEAIALQITTSATGTGAQYQPPRTFGLTVGAQF